MVGQFKHLYSRILLFRKLLCTALLCVAFFIPSFAYISPQFDEIVVPLQQTTQQGKQSKINRAYQKRLIMQPTTQHSYIANGNTVGKLQLNSARQIHSYQPYGAGASSTYTTKFNNNGNYASSAHATAYLQISQQQVTSAPQTQAVSADMLPSTQTLMAVSRMNMDDDDDDWNPGGTGDFDNPGDVGQAPLHDATLFLCLLVLLYAVSTYFRSQRITSNLKNKAYEKNI